LAGQFQTRWAPACAVESPKLNEVGAAPTHRANSRGHMCRSGETVSQSVCGGCNSHCLHQFARAMIRPAVCRTAVIKKGRKTTSGALPPSPTSSATRKRNSRLACLSSRRQRGQHPSGSPFIGHEEDSNPPGLGPGDTRGRTEVSDHFDSP